MDDQTTSVDGPDFEFIEWRHANFRIHFTGQAVAAWEAWKAAKQLQASEVERLTFLHNLDHALADRYQERRFMAEHEAEILQAEVIRLRESQARLMDGWDDWDKQLRECRVRCYRLRAALGKIADGATATLDQSHPWVGKLARESIVEDHEMVPDLFTRDIDGNYHPLFQAFDTVHQDERVYISGGGSLHKPHCDCMDGALKRVEQLQALLAEIERIATDDDIDGPSSLQQIRTLAAMPPNEPTHE